MTSYWSVSMSRSRTSLRRVAVSLWPQWLSLQGGGGGGRGRFLGPSGSVQGCTMAGWGGGGGQWGGNELSNLVFGEFGCFHLPHQASSKSRCRGRTMSMGSDLIYEPFKKDGIFLTIEEHMRSQEPMNTMKYSQFVYNISPFCFGYHEWEIWMSSLVTSTWKYILEERWILLESEILIDLDFWANSVSFVQTFQWVWMDSYLCILVTRAGFHRGTTPLIGCLCCVQVKGPSWRKSKWLCPKSSVSVSLCLLSCWYKEPCVERWCDVWICWCSARQLFLRMYVYACIWGGGGEVCTESMRFEIERLGENKWTETFLDQLRGPSFPRSVTLFAARCQWFYYHETTFHFTSWFQFRNSLEKPCVCFWCYMYKGNKNNHNRLHLTKSMWVLKCSVLQNDQSGIKLQHCWNRKKRRVIWVLVGLKPQDPICLHLYLSIWIIFAL